MRFMAIISAAVISLASAAPSTTTGDEVDDPVLDELLITSFFRRELDGTIERASFTLNGDKGTDLFCEYILKVHYHDEMVACDSGLSVYQFFMVSDYELGVYRDFNDV